MPQRRRTPRSRTSQQQMIAARETLERLKARTDLTPAVRNLVREAIVYLTQNEACIRERVTPHD